MSTEDAFDEALLRRYLLGQTSDADTERIDELSVTSEDVAAQLQAVEYDLVDAYVAGELTGEALEAFRQRYRAQADGRAEIRFAETLRAYQTRSQPGSTGQRRGTFGIGSMSRWALALAAMLVLTVLVSAWLLIDNRSLRNQVAVAHADRATIDDRARVLQQQLEDMAKDLARLRATPSPVPAPSPSPAIPTVIASFVLPPSTRGASELTKITLASDVTSVRLHVPLEGDRFSTFDVALRDAASNQIVWHANGLHAANERGQRAVAVTVPANLLKTRTYLLELSGARGAGSPEPEPIGSFAFQVALP